MSSGRLDKDGEPIINQKNLTKKTKTYIENSRTKKKFVYFRTIQRLCIKFLANIVFRKGRPIEILAHALAANFKKIIFASLMKFFVK